MSRYEIEPGVFRADPFEGMPRGHFKAIYADPPWRWESWGKYRGPRSGLAPKGDRSADKHYDTAETTDIAALPVADLAAPDCVLFMWATWPMIDHALALIEAWGFEYKTCAFCWTKADARQMQMFDESITADMLLGYWTRANSEPCLLATRGKPKRLNADVRQAIIEPRREHSRKPDCVPSRIERLVDGPYLELFARTQRPGWTVWGNQTDKFTPAGVAA
jgi:N6-adenosine-specific RNA methylase IME4